MSLTHDYLQLYKAFAETSGELSVKVTSEQLAAALFCTTRNAKLIIHKMVDRGWIRYRPGRGRGNPSEIAFLLNFEETFEQEVKSLVKEGKVETAFEMVRTYGEHSRFRQEAFTEWLSGYFGYSVESRHDRYLETLKLPIFREINGINTLDPAESFYSLDMHLIKQLYDTLVDVDPASGQYTGAIAHHWKRDESAQEWTFYLRKGVYFHHGRELTAEDVRFSLLRLRDGSYEQRWLAEDIESVTILYKYAVRVKLKQPNWQFPAFAGYPPMSIVPQEYGDKKSAFKPVGTGPFRFVEQDSGRYVIEAFDRHYAGRALIDRIELTLMPFDQRIALNPSAFLLVDTDDNPGNRPINVPDWRQRDKVTGCTILTLNQSKQGPLTDRHLRLAIQKAINRHRMVEELGNSRLYPAYGFYSGEERVIKPDLDWDLGQASRLLEKTSYRGETLRLMTYQRHAADAYWLKRELSVVGIKLEIDIVLWRDLLKASSMELADMILFELPGVEGTIRLFESYKSHFIRAHLSEAQARAVDAEIGRLLAAPEERGQREILRSLEQWLKTETAFVFLVHKYHSSYTHPSLHGASLNARGWVDFKELWYDHEHTILKQDEPKR